MSLDFFDLTLSNAVSVEDDNVGGDLILLLEAGTHFDHSLAYLEHQVNAFFVLLGGDRLILGLLKV